MNHPPAYVTKRPSLLHTAELESVTSSCRKQVERIARDCRAENRKFRDIEFDLENDQHRCLYGLFSRPGENFAPSDVLRATKIFKNAEFFVNGTPDSTQIVQGNIGDCWFLSALSSVATAPGLLEQICVARDERVGVYGFIFFRDNRWVDVIIDDLLCTRRPKFEDLSLFEQGLYLDDKDYYLKSASINDGKTLYFARSGTHNATWVPLIEKAYAKLHGHYGYLHLGKTCEAMEDLTGGVSKGIFTNDILDPDRFWTDELLRANKDRLFTCQIHEPNSNRVNQSEIKIQGLVTAHAYTVLRAVECRGKKFVVLRNPWGRIEWTGRWSDGSKEWTKEWIAVLDELGHSFGDDGQFIMEYNDWLECFTDIDRTLLFDTSWKMSSHWLGVACRPLPTPLSYGDVSFIFTVPTAASTVISLAQLDTKYFRDIASRSLYTLDFVLVKEGEEEPVMESQHTKFQARDVSVEAYLEAGTYIVYARFDRVIDPTAPVELNIEDWQLLKLSRVMTKRAEGRAVASNSIHPYNQIHLPKPLKNLIQSAKTRYQRKQELQRQNQRGDASETDTEYFTDDDESPNHTEKVTKTTTTVVVEKTRVKKPRSKPTTQPQPKPSIISVPSSTATKQIRKRNQKYTSKHKSLPSPPRYNGHTRDHRIGVGAPRAGPAPYITPWQPVPARNHNYYYTGPGPANQWSRPTSPSPPEPLKDKLTNVKILRDDENIIYLGLKVYANTGEDGAEVEIVGRIGDVPSDDDRDDLSSARGRSLSRARSRTRSRSVSRRRSRTSSSSRSALRR